MRGCIFIYCDVVVVVASKSSVQILSPHLSPCMIFSLLLNNEVSFYLNFKYNSLVKFNK